MIKKFLTIALLFYAPIIFSMQIDGNSGTASGSPITITTGASYANGTASFTGDNAQTITFSFSDQFNNIGIGANALAPQRLGAISGENISIGDNSGLSLFSGAGNVLVGVAAGSGLVSGNNNILIGTNAGSDLQGSESNNVYIADQGLPGESNTLRIDSQGGDVSTTYIGGIAGVVVTPANQNIVTIDTITNQLGSLRFFTLPNQPAMLAYLSATQSSVTGDGTAYTVPFDTASYEKFNSFAPGGGFYSVVDGVYSFHAAVNISGYSMGAIATLDLVTNSSGTYRLAARTFGFSFEPVTLSGSINISMVSGDEATLVLTVTNPLSGATVNVNGGTGPIITYFNGTLLN